MNEKEHESEEISPSKTRRTLKGVAVLLAAGSVISVLAIVFVVMRSEMRHRESECPFEERSIRRLSSTVSIREEARSCDTDTAEHRFWMLRDGQEPRLLGGRRLPKERYSQDRYRWSVEEGSRGILIRIENDDIEDAVFHELPPKRRSEKAPGTQ